MVLAKESGSLLNTSLKTVPMPPPLYLLGTEYVVHSFTLDCRYAEMNLRFVLWSQQLWNLRHSGICRVWAGHLEGP